MRVAAFPHATGMRRRVMESGDMTTIETETRFAAARTSGGRKIWDAPVRLFHGALILAVTGAFVTNRLGVAYFKYHLLCGYAVILLVAFRILWGVFGTRHARFSNFVRGPRAVLAYVGDLSRGRAAAYAGHNPLGALMVVALLAALAAQAAAGLFANDEIFNAGPFAALVSKETGLRLTGLHKTLFYWIVVAVALHIVGVLAHVLGKGEALLRAMITGRKPDHATHPSDAISSSRLAVAAAIFIAVAFAFAAVLQAAPTPDLSVDGF
jgi:cytochrome b